MVEILKKAITVLLILLTIKYGVIGLTWGWAISNIISLLLTLFLTNRIVHYSLIDLLKDIFPYFSISSVLCLAGWFISKPIINHYLFLLFCISFVGILYFLACYLLKLEASEELFRWLHKKRRK